MVVECAPPAAALIATQYPKSVVARVDGAPVTESERMVETLLDREVGRKVPERRGEPADGLRPDEDHRHPLCGLQPFERLKELVDDELASASR